MSAMDSLSGVQRLSPAQRTIDLWMREERHSWKPNILSMALSLSSIMIVGLAAVERLATTIVQGHGAILDESEAPPRRM
jgi:hypothetical protein